VLLQSLAFASPKEAGQAITRLQNEKGAALTALAAVFEPMTPEKHRLICENLDLL